jgi:SAM-dependent methyltransferase
MIPEMKESAVATGPRHRFDPRRVRCPLCDSESIRPYLTDFRGIAIDRCGACRLRFMNPQYTQEALDEYYSRYTSHDSGHIVSAHHGPRRERKRRNLGLLAAYLPERARFLSIGCGDGLELALARERGFTVEAYDVDPEAATAVRTATGIEVATGDLFDGRYDADAYDCVFLDQVLEHPKEPARYLRWIRDRLRAGGVVYLGVPNIASASNAWKSLQDRLHLRNGSRRGKHFDTWHHLHYYSPACLRRVLPRFGFDVESIHGDPEPQSSSILYSLRRALPVLESSMIVVARKV